MRLSLTAITGLLAIGVVPVLGTTSTAPATTARADSSGIFRVEELADGVWAAVVRARPDAYAFSNSLVVETPDGVVVVDTQQSPEAARDLLSLIRLRTDAPVRWVVNTHWHGDHVNGNQVYRDAFPGVGIVAHRQTRLRMLADGRERRLEELAELPSAIRERRRWLETGKGPDGRVLSAEELEAVGRSVVLRERYLAELRELRETPPDIVFEDRLTVHLGDRELVLLHVGPAHTPGDVVVYLPAEEVVAVGDLLEEGPLWLDGADVPGWAGALAEVTALGATTFLPSHGGVHRDGQLLGLQSDLLGGAVEAARTALSLGFDAEEAVRSSGARSLADAMVPRLAGLGLSEKRGRAHVEEVVRKAHADLADAGGR